MNKVKLLLIGGLAIVVSLIASAQTLYNRFGPANGILVGNTASPTTTSATSTDVLALWSGTCADTTFMRGDGSCQVPPPTTGTGIPGGLNTYVQYNDTGSFSGDADFVFNSTNNRLTLGAAGDSQLWVGGTNPEKIRLLAADGTGDNYIRAFSSNGTTPRWFLGNGNPDDNNVSLHNIFPGASLDLVTTSGGALTLNGVNATDFARLSQSNAFTGAYPQLILQANSPGLSLREADAAANNGRWDIGPSVESLLFQIVNDAAGTFTTWLQVDRTGTSVDSINLLATDVQVNGATVRSAAFDRIARARLANVGSSCAATSTAGITSSTANAGACVVDYTAAGFGAAPVCTVAVQDGTPWGTARVSIATQTQVVVSVRNSTNGLITILDAYLICMGQ